jgi:SulP family sulfate permease
MWATMGPTMVDVAVLFPPLRVSRDFIDYPYFADLGAVQAAAVLRAAGKRAALHTVVLSLEESADLDATAVECLLELNQRLAASGQKLVLARVKDEVRALLARVDPQGLGAPERLFWSVADAARA